jgi:hypothetical protein
MAAKLNRLAHKIAIQVHLVADSCTICSPRSRRPVRKLLDTTSYVYYRDNFACGTPCLSERVSGECQSDYECGRMSDSTSDRGTVSE